MKKALKEFFTDMKFYRKRTVTVGIVGAVFAVLSSLGALPGVFMMGDGDVVYLLF